MDALVDAGAARAAAAEVDMTAGDYKAMLREDSTIRVDDCAMTFAVDPVPEADATVGPHLGGVLSTGALDSNGDAFALSSRPDSTKTIYLDFTTTTITGTQWNASYNGGAAWTAPAFSLDTDTTTFSTAERDAIREVWLRVAEDYAPFDVNVTTKDPGSVAIDRVDSGDNVYGTRALVTNDTLLMNKCTCGGIAYLDVFDTIGSSRAYLQPAFVFYKNLWSTKALGEAASHEVGHNLGLEHDGRTSPQEDYYYGQGSWAPIMGVGYREPLVQWSKGDYTSASNTEDDLAVIASNGLSLMTDDHGGTPAEATAVTLGEVAGGLISTRADVDYFRVDVPSATGVTISVAPQATSANLDVKLFLYGSDGTLLANADPEIASRMYPSDFSTPELGATITLSVPAGTYYAAVDGVGSGDPSVTGYSDYGSLGRYTISADSDTALPLTVATYTTPPRGVTGSPYSYPLTATGGRSPYVWTTTAGSLPTGLSLDAATGAISGTPTSLTTLSLPFTVTATDAAGATASRTVTVTTVPALGIAAVDPPRGTTGTGYSLTLAPTGGTGPYTWTVADGLLPTGLVLSAAGKVTGNPTQPGVFTATVKVTDTSFGGAQTATKDLVVAVIAPFKPGTVIATPGTVGAAYATTLAASGGAAPYTWSKTSGTLPAGLTLSSAGVVSGSPTTAGTFVFTTKITDASPGIALATTQTVTITITKAVTVTSAAAPRGTVGAPYVAVLTATGGAAPYTWTVASGTFPAGLTLSLSGRISGTPTEAGSGTVTVRVTDGTSTRTATAELSIPVVIALTATPVSAPQGTTGVGYGVTLGASGGVAPYTWTVASGALPAGLTLSAAGLVTGTPSRAGTANLVFRVTDASQVTAQSATLIVPITVMAPVTVTAATLTVGTADVAYPARKLTATGGSGGLQWAVTAGAKPSGMTLSATGTLSGTPTDAGTYVFTVTVTDAVGRTGTGTYKLSVLKPVVIPATSLTSGVVGVPYPTETLNADGGTGTYTWTRVIGLLPNGLALSGAGKLTGKPTKAGTFTFTVRATDSAKRVGIAVVTIVVGPKGTTVASAKGSKVWRPSAKAKAALRAAVMTAAKSRAVAAKR